MADLVERLRENAKPVGFHVPICGEAADEIERLRKDVTMAVEALERIGKESPAHRELVRSVWAEVKGENK
jgi:hypothetical protein